MPYIGTAILYTILLFVIYSLCRGKGKTVKKNNIIIAYVIIFIMSFLRFDVGNDYEDYYKSIVEIGNLLDTNVSLKNYYINYLVNRFEPSFFIISILFSWTSHPFIWVFGFYSLTFLILIYKTFDRYNCHAMGLVVLFISGALFVEWDQIRQGVSIAFALFSIQYIEDKKIVKFAFCVLGAYIFHHSSIVIAPIYLLRYLKINRWISVSIVGVTLLLSLTGFFENLIDQLEFVFAMFSDTKYENYANAAGSLLLFDSTNWKIRMIIYSLFWCVPLVLLPKEESVKSNLVLLGAVIFLAACGRLTFTRIAWDYLIAILVAFPLSLNYTKGTSKRVVSGILLMMCVMFFYDSSTGSNARGCTPYQTVLSHNYKTKNFTKKQ